MKKTLIVIVVLIVVLGIVYFVVNSNSNMASVNNSQTYTPPTQTQVNTETNVQAPIVEPQTPPKNTQSTTTPTSVSINIKGFVFTPSTLTIKTGTKVTWTNNDSVAHTVTSDSGNLLNSATLSPGQSFSFTFINPGSVNYHCAIHPMMKGSIVVQ